MDFYSPLKYISNVHFLVKHSRVKVMWLVVNTVDSCCIAIKYFIQWTSSLLLAASEWESWQRGKGTNIRKKYKELVVQFLGILASYTPTTHRSWLYLRLQSSLQLIQPLLLVHHPGPLRLQLLVRAADHLQLRPLSLGHQPEHLLLSHLEKRHHEILIKGDFFAVFFRVLSGISLFVGNQNPAMVTSFIILSLSAFFSSSVCSLPPEYLIITRC